MIKEKHFIKVSENSCFLKKQKPFLFHSKSFAFLFAQTENGVISFQIFLFYATKSKPLYTNLNSKRVLKEDRKR